MKTFIIHESVDDCVQIFVVDGNHENLDETYIGSGENEGNENYLVDLLYGEEQETIAPTDIHLRVRELMIEEDDFVFIVTGELA